MLDPFRNEIFSWLGGNEAHKLRDGTTGQCSFNEPQGISSLFDDQAQDVKIYICDTNNHCIRQCLYDLGHVTTCNFRGIPAPSEAQFDQKRLGSSQLNCQPNECVPSGHYE